jgi:hypothetical protein
VVGTLQARRPEFLGRSFLLLSWSASDPSVTSEAIRSSADADGKPDIRGLAA